MSKSKAGFEAVLDVGGFSIEEITVKTDERFLIVIGEHEEDLPDQGYLARHFIRRYLLPDDIQTDGLASNINGEGLLTVTAPVKDPSIRTKKTLKGPI